MTILTFLVCAFLAVTSPFWLPVLIGMAALFFALLLALCVLVMAWAFEGVASLGVRDPDCSARTFQHLKGKDDASGNSE